VLAVCSGRCVCDREVYSGLETGGVSSESSESEPSDGLNVNGSWSSSSSSSSLSSTDAAPEVEVLGIGESGLVVELEPGGGRSRVEVSRDRSVGRFGVDLD
jgi:hypothetical protein